MYDLFQFPLLKVNEFNHNLRVSHVKCLQFSEKLFRVYLSFENNCTNIANELIFIKFQIDENNCSLTYVLYCKDTILFFFFNMLILSHFIELLRWYASFWSSKFVVHL